MSDARHNLESNAQEVRDAAEALEVEIAALKAAETLTDAQRARRDELVGMMRESGFTYRQIADLFGMKFSDVTGVGFKAKRAT